MNTNATKNIMITILLVLVNNVGASEIQTLNLDELLSFIS